MSKHRHEIRTILLDSFQSSYITLISIFQGALFAYLITKMPDFSNFHQLKNGEIRFVICLLSIFLVWNEYTIGARIYRWIPTTKDTLIPFFITLFQYKMIASINADNNHFISFYLAFWFTAVIAYSNMYLMVQKFKEFNISTYRYSKLDSYQTHKLLLFFVFVILGLLVISFLKKEIDIRAYELFLFLLIFIFLFFRRIQYKKILLHLFPNYRFSFFHNFLFKKKKKT